MTDDDPEEPSGPTPEQLLARSREAWSRIPALREAMIEGKSQGAMIAYQKGMATALDAQKAAQAVVRCACGCGAR